MQFENIKVTSENGIGQITINRPSKLNALNVATIKELHDGLESLDTNPEIRVIIVTGEGEKAFVAGADISEFTALDAAGGEALAKKGQDNVFDKFQNSIHLFVILLLYISCF